MNPVQQHDPGTAEYALSLLTTRGTLCPHNPKLRTTAQSVQPSCVGLFHRESKTILLLRTACVCKSCYEKAVLNGYLVQKNPIKHSVNEDTPTASSGSEWWHFKPVGFELYGLRETVRLPLQASSEEHRALLLFSAQSRPFYMPLFHTLGRVIPRHIVDMDYTIITAHGLPLQPEGFTEEARPDRPSVKPAFLFNGGGRGTGAQDNNVDPLAPMFRNSMREQAMASPSSRGGHGPQSQQGQLHQDQGLRTYQLTTRTA